jgi:hypothetical protein
MEWLSKSCHRSFSNLGCLTGGVIFGFCLGFAWNRRGSRNRSMVHVFDPLLFVGKLEGAQTIKLIILSNNWGARAFLKFAVIILHLRRWFVRCHSFHGGVSSRPWPPDYPYFHSYQLPSATRSISSSRSPPRFPGSAAVSQIRSPVSVTSTYFPICSIPSLQLLSIAPQKFTYQPFSTSTFLPSSSFVYVQSVSNPPSQAFQSPENPKHQQYIRFQKSSKKCLRTEKSSR